ncbi:MAG: Calx-beta domain-containing protein [Pirellulales bacterium]
MPSVSITASDAAAAETLSTQTANTGTYVITRTGSTTAALTVNIALSGSATNGTDYKSIPTSVTIPAGATSATITLTPIDDSIVEGSETAVITLSSGTGYSVDGVSSSALVTIADNDVATSTNNDMFANRVVLVGQTVSATGSNATATKEKGEPNVAGVSGGKSVWWTWTAPVSGTVAISTAGSNFDTTLGVYRGTAVSSLTRVATNDDDATLPGALTSRLSFTATAGTVYQIVVDGYSGDSGNIKLQLTETASRSAKTKSVPMVSSNDVATGTNNNLRNRQTHAAPPVEQHTHYNRHIRRVDQVFAGSIRDLF